MGSLGPFKEKLEKAMTRELVAVVGAGVMGCDIALDLSLHNYDVILKDVTDELLQRGKDNIIRNFRYVKMFKKTFQGTSTAEILSRIKFTNLKLPCTCQSW